MTLKDVSIGKSVRIDSLKNSKIKERLMTMGLTPGTFVKVSRASLFGDPIVLCLRSYNLAIRKKEAETIQVSNTVY